MTLRVSAVIVGLVAVLSLPTIGSARTRYDEGRYDSKGIPLTKPDASGACTCQSGSEMLSISEIMGDASCAKSICLVYSALIALIISITWWLWPRTA